MCSATFTNENQNHPMGERKRIKRKKKSINRFHAAITKSISRPTFKRTVKKKNDEKEVVERIMHKPKCGTLRRSPKLGNLLFMLRADVF